MLRMEGLPTKEITIEVIDFDKLTKEQKKAVFNQVAIDIIKDATGDTSELENASPIDFAREMYHRSEAVLQYEESK